MALLSIVEDLDVIEHGVGQFERGLLSLSIEEFDLHAHAVGLIDEKDPDVVDHFSHHAIEDPGPTSGPRRVLRVKRLRRHGS